MGSERLIGDAGVRQLLGDWMRESWAWKGVGRVCAKWGSCAAFMACCRDLAFFAFMHMFLLLCCLLYWAFFIILRAWGGGVMRLFRDVYLFL